MRFLTTLVIQMNKLDKALYNFWANNDGKQPTVIYIGWNNLRDILISDGYFQVDKMNKTYNGIPYFRVSEDEHLAVY